MNEKYRQILNMPHHISQKHPQMSLYNRAAQFAPFAALTGYGDAIDETARLTDNRQERGEDAIAEIDNKLQFLCNCGIPNPQISVTYFCPDSKKEGGAYITKRGRFLKTENTNGCIVFCDGEKISICDIYDLNGEIFEE